jgi:tRNA G18 (ribose-2'-O)-methylase SpoU
VSAGADHFSALTQGRCRLTVIAEPAMATLAGFPFRRGVLGTGKRPPALPLDVVAARARLLVGLPEVNTVGNLGAPFRSASALGERWRPAGEAL